MKKMRLGKRREKAFTKAESIFDTEKRLREEAITISKNFKHTNPVILLTANGTKRQLN
jgi:hypothetical protein